ncbi:MAG: methylated-DNA--[protein]-cysteine S-methyltransferase [Rikenellaceae bacterium]
MKIYPSPIGYIKIEHRDDKLTLLQVQEGEPKEYGEADPFTDMVYGQLMEYLNLKRKVFDIQIDISSSTPFQRSVLEELRKIPYGETRTYKEIATAIGNPKASRAVGAANNHNPIHIIIPCHRVIGSGGTLKGYAAGVEAKIFLLRLERL